MNKKHLDPSTCLFPLPTVLVSCRDPGSNTSNIITLAWVGVLSSDPPVIGIAIRPSRYSHGLIERAGEFVVNIPEASQLHAVDACGFVSGKEVDKFTACGFTAGEARDVSCPVIVECPVNIECKLVRVVTGYSKSHHLFLGEVVRVSVRDDLDGIDMGAMDPIAYCNGEYRALGKKIGRVGLSKKR